MVRRLHGPHQLHGLPWHGLRVHGCQPEEPDQPRWLRPPSRYRQLSLLVLLRLDDPLFRFAGLDSLMEGTFADRDLRVIFTTFIAFLARAIALAVLFISAAAFVYPGKELTSVGPNVFNRFTGFVDSGKFPRPSSTLAAAIRAAAVVRSIHRLLKLTMIPYTAYPGK